MLGLRDKNRYGKFEANSDEGEVIVTIGISGFGEEIEIKNMKGKTIMSCDSGEYPDDWYEDDEKIIIYGDISVEIYKPFIKRVE